MVRQYLCLLGIRFHTKLPTGSLSVAPIVQKRTSRSVIQSSNCTFLITLPDKYKYFPRQTNTCLCPLHPPLVRVMEECIRQAPSICGLGEALVCCNRLLVGVKYCSTEDSLKVVRSAMLLVPLGMMQRPWHVRTNMFSFYVSRVQTAWLQLGKRFLRFSQWICALNI